MNKALWFWKEAALLIGRVVFGLRSAVDDEDRLRLRGLALRDQVHTELVVVGRHLQVPSDAALGDVALAEAVGEVRQLAHPRAGLLVRLHIRGELEQGEEGRGLEMVFLRAPAMPFEVW